MYVAPDALYEIVVVAMGGAESMNDLLVQLSRKVIRELTLEEMSEELTEHFKVGTAVDEKDIARRIEEESPLPYKDPDSDGAR